MSCWILWLLLFCGCGCNNAGERGSEGNGCCGGRSAGGRGGNSGNASCGSAGEDNGCGGTSRSGAAMPSMPSAWSSDCGCGQEPMPFSGRQDFPSVGRGETCGCEKQD